MTNDLSKYAPVDPYATELAVLRAASATPESKQEDAVIAKIAADLAQQHREYESFRAAQAPTPRTSAAELARFAAPDPYGPALRALREAR